MLQTYNLVIDSIIQIGYPDEDMVVLVPTSASHVSIADSVPLKIAIKTMEEHITYGYKDVSEDVWSNATYNGKSIARMLARTYEIFGTEEMTQYLFVLRNIKE